MKFNKVVFFLTLSDVFTWGFMSILGGLSGVFLSMRLEHDIVRVVATGSSVYLLLTGLFQIPFGIIGDKIKSDKDEITMLMIGNILMGIPFLFYPIISAPLLYYVLQGILGLGASINLVNWRKLFAKNLNGHSAGSDYGVYGAIMNISAAGFGLLTGFLGNLNETMFNVVLVSIGLLMILSCVFVALIFKVEDRKSMDVLDVTVSK